MRKNGNKGFLLLPWKPTFWNLCSWRDSRNPKDPEGLRRKKFTKQLLHQVDPTVRTISAMDETFLAGFDLETTVVSKCVLSKGSIFNSCRSDQSHLDLKKERSLNRSVPIQTIWIP
jgi:hypothetical protein